MIDYKTVINDLVYDCRGFNSNTIRSSADILPEHRLCEDLGMDSLNLIEAVMACEEEFDMDIPDDIMYDISVVEHLYEIFGDG